MCQCQWLSGRSDPLWTEDPGFEPQPGHRSTGAWRSSGRELWQAVKRSEHGQRREKLRHEGGSKDPDAPPGLHRQYPAAVIQNHQTFIVRLVNTPDHRPSPPFFSLMNINIQPPQCPPHSSRCYLLNAQQDLIQDSSAPDTCTWRRGRLTRLEE